MGHPKDSDNLIEKKTEENNKVFFKKKWKTSKDVIGKENDINLCKLFKPMTLGTNKTGSITSGKQLF